MPRRLVLPSLIATALVLAAPPHARSQDTTLTDARQWANFAYGDSVTFNIEVSAPSVLTSARLVVIVAGQDTPYSESPAIMPATQVKLSQTVAVGSLLLPPFADLSYYWEFGDETNRTYRTDTQSLRYEDTSVPWTWVGVSQDGVTVYTNGRDDAVTQAALDVATAAFGQIRRTLGVSQPETITVYVYPELAPLANSLRLHGRRVQDWVAAYALPSQHVALVAAGPGPEMLVNLQRDLPHEVTHLVIGAAAGEHHENVPAWFNEGLALMSAREPDLALRSALETAVREKALLPVEALCVNSFSSLPPQEAALAYAQSESLMRYITSRYGVAQINALLNAYASGQSCAGAVQQVLGLSLAELQTQWHNGLLNQAARTPRESTSLVPWIIAWLVSMALALLFVAPQPNRSPALSRAAKANHDPPAPPEGSRLHD